MANIITVYGLTNPKNEIFYIGVTSRNPFLRFYHHILELKYIDTKKTREIFNIIINGEYIGINILKQIENTPDLDVRELEEKYINLYTKLGYNLLQNTNSSYSSTTIYNSINTRIPDIIKCQDNIREFFILQNKQKEIFKKANLLGYSEYEIIKLYIKKNGDSFTLYNKDKTQSIFIPKGIFIDKFIQTKKLVK